MVKKLCIREAYKKDGEEVVSWKELGVLIDGKEGKQYVKLYHMPGTMIHVFSKEKKENTDSGDINF